MTSGERVGTGIREGGERIGVSRLKISSGPYCRNAVVHMGAPQRDPLGPL
jgi:hypothetical protein